jgi:hypothetical protein
MSSFRNGPSQVVSTSGFVTVDFPVQIVPGNNPIVNRSNYTYAYHLNLVKPSGEAGPTPVTAVLAINGENEEHSRSFGEIDTGGKISLSHAGELRQLQIGDLLEVRVRTDPDALVDDTLQIRTAPQRCTLTWREVAGPGS